MKRTLIGLLLALLCIFIPEILQAQQVCTNPQKTYNADAFPKAQRLSRIQQELSTNLSAYGVLDNQSHLDHYEVCLVMSELTVDAINGEAALLITAPLDAPLYVGGLKLQRNAAASTTLPLVIARSTGAKKIILANFTFTNVVKGLQLEGTGSIEIQSSSITGDPNNKTGSCIDVKSPDAILSGVNVSKCKTGVLVEANNLTLNSILDAQKAVIGPSEIKYNGIGVNIGSVTGTKIVNTLIYGNDDGDDTNLPNTDGIRFDGGSSGFEPALYEVTNGKMAEVSDGSDAYVFQNKTAYLRLYVSENQQPVSVELFASQGGDCGAGIGSHGQACAFPFPGTPPQPSVTIIDPAKLPTSNDQPAVTAQLPTDAPNLTLVAIYTDPVTGVSGFSRAFKVQTGGVVAFVATPYDIPTTGGATDNTGDNQQGDGANSMGGSSMGEGAGDSLTGAADGGGAAAAGPSGMKCSLTPSATNLLPSGWGVDLGWLLLGLGFLGGARLAPARVRIRRHRK